MPLCSVSNTEAFLRPVTRPIIYKDFSTQLLPFTVTLVRILLLDLHSKHHGSTPTCFSDFPKKADAGLLATLCGKQNRAVHGFSAKLFKRLNLAALGEKTRRNPNLEQGWNKFP